MGISQKILTFLQSVKVKLLAGTSITCYKMNMKKIKMCSTNEKISIDNDKLMINDGRSIDHVYV